MGTKYFKYVLIIISFLLFSYCKSYVRVAPENPELCFQSDKAAQLHYAGQQIYFDEITVDENGLRGILKDELVKYKYKMGVQTTKPYIPRQEKLIHIYLNESFLSNKKKGDTAHIPYASIETIEVYEVDKKKSVVYGLGTMGVYGLGGAAVTYGVIIVILILFKSSCPFIYINDGENYNLAGEIFSGAVFPPIERHDYLKLPAQGIDDQCKMLVANEVKEIQHINTLEMIVLDHKPQTQVLIDKYGSVHAANNILPPADAVN